MVDVKNNVAYFDPNVLVDKDFTSAMYSAIDEHLEFYHACPECDEVLVELSASDVDLDVECSEDSLLDYDTRIIMDVQLKYCPACHHVEGRLEVTNHD